ncbi:LytR/AlgR family response regulator transcription factor [Pontimicrobium aquaticum]|uniref:Response regulator transcription factor n=1 Tax=Pontimicrobium aquaticum TaxID=2565367 RepID=A0A4U0EP88_9FLAO|nr:LytTR family DNA-binding domain-containing protein [Pontimicrobium aquaticum]TJY33360.1 response regulator transcription factor [Pontimicrobium aquaticum]
MNVVIVEDEIPALEKLERYILKYDNTINILAKLTSIQDTVTWLQSHKDSVDMLFLDIQLSEGLSFEIFNQIQLEKPIIFTTAFDEFAIDAFKLNSIDYILKPITFTDVSKALTKFKDFKSILSSSTLKNVSNAIVNKSFKDRFLVRLGNHIHSIKTNKIALFYAEGRTVFLVTTDAKKFVLDYKLEDLNQIVNPQNFMRVNRTFIINLDAIKDVIVYSNSRLKLILNVATDNDIIVSRDRVSRFKAWFGGN